MQAAALAEIGPSRPLARRVYPFARLAKLLHPAPKGQKYFLVLTLYADESYNPNCFVVAGWIGTDKEWAKIQSQWLRRVDHDRRKHGGILTRYHASDCSSRKNEYQGWSLDDQIQHSKALLRILSRRELVGVFAGIDMRAMREVFPEEPDQLGGAYMMAMLQLLERATRVVKRGYRLSVIHDQCDWNADAQRAWGALRKHRPDLADKIVTIAPMGWRDCAALQPADLFAFETFKFLDRNVQQKLPPRRSLQALVGGNARVLGHHFTEKNLRKLRADYEAHQAASG